MYSVIPKTPSSKAAKGFGQPLESLHRQVFVHVCFGVVWCARRPLLWCPIKIFFLFTICFLTLRFVVNADTLHPCDCIAVLRCTIRRFVTLRAHIMLTRSKKKSGRQLVALGMKSGESLSIDTPAVQELIAKVADPQLTVCIASTKGIVSKSECSLTFVVLCCWLTHPTLNRTLTFYILLLVRCMITVPGPACNSW